MASVPITLNLDDVVVQQWQRDEDLDHGLCEFCSAQLTDDDEDPNVCNECMEQFK